MELDSESSEEDPDMRIIGGQEAAPHALPWQGQDIPQSLHQCVILSTLPFDF